MEKYWFSQKKRDKLQRNFEVLFSEVKWTHHNPFWDHLEKRSEWTSPCTKVLQRTPRLNSLFLLLSCLESVALVELLRPTFHLLSAKPRLNFRTATKRVGADLILQSVPFRRHLCQNYARHQGSSGTALIRFYFVCKRRRKMSNPNYSGTFHMVEQDNMDEYLAALGGTLNTFAQINIITVINNNIQTSSMT